MALCFTMAVFSVICGFSLEPGAFVMGSILAGTVLAERIDRLITPVKNLFGSVFFIPVGMMVDPHVIATYWWQILLLAAVVIAGMIFFGTLGMLVTGQNLRVAMESGFTLTQIGEFSFIIASLGMGLGVLDSRIYPIIVAVSVLTIFTIPISSRWPTERTASWSAISCKSPLSHRPVFGAELRHQRNAPSMARHSLRDISGESCSIRLSCWRRSCFRRLSSSFRPRSISGHGDIRVTVITVLAMLPFLMALCFSSTKEFGKKGTAAPVGGIL